MEKLKTKIFTGVKAILFEWYFSTQTFVLVTVKSLSLQNTFYNRLPFIMEVGWDC